MDNETLGLEMKDLAFQSVRLGSVWPLGGWIVHTDEVVDTSLDEG